MPTVEDPEVDLVLGFLNTVDHARRTDAFESPDGYRAWLLGHGLPAGDSDPVEARRVREALRSAAGGDGSSGAVLEAVPVRAGLRPDGTPVLTSPDPLGLVVAAALALAGDGRWVRVRLCHAPDCRWAFYDLSKNRSRQWCAMSSCGNRSKSRALRARRRTTHREATRE